MYKGIWCVLLMLSLPAFAIKNDEARYIGGTAANIRMGTVCRLNLASDESLIIESRGQRLAIPYADIDSFQYSKEAKWRFGVLPAIAIGLIRPWPRAHFFRITFHDQHKVPQVVVFEVPKTAPRALQAVLEARVPRSCAVPARCDTRNSALSCANPLPSYNY